ncbi:MAG: carboxypeptidase regulatory-like domain-containing protein [Actinobacteria bacterium]|nr:carboxypeptidase regulatory-like domain-containing protein [Actinomycetota bacterium]
MKILFVVVVVLLAGCSSSPSATTVTFSVQGHVHAGPTCPVMREPPDPDCADRPVVGAELLVWGPADNEVARTRTDGQGRFSLDLPAGTYTLVPQPVEGLLGTASEQQFTVPETEPLDVAYDTGIR